MGLGCTFQPKVLSKQLRICFKNGLTMSCEGDALLKQLMDRFSVLIIVVMSDLDFAEYFASIKLVYLMSKVVSSSIGL